MAKTLVFRVVATTTGDGVWLLSLASLAGENQGYRIVMPTELAIKLGAYAGDTLMLSTIDGR